MAPRTRKQHEEGEQETVSFAEVMQEAQNPDALIEHLRDGFLGLHAHIDKVDAQVGALKDEIQGPRYMQVASDGEHAKVMRRRALDEMEFALKRLTSPDPRPQDDDSPLVLQDAINEVIALRQIMQDLMQASANVYQRGLASIRDMTSR